MGQPTLFDGPGDGGGDRPPDGIGDPALDQVESWFRGQPSHTERLADVLRQSIDEVLDGQRTGRFDIAQLAKTEKTYLGTKIEILCQAEFGLHRGRHMDYLVAGEEVDCKFSLSFGGWPIPREAVGQICLLMHADDQGSRYSAGLLRTAPELLSTGTNQDGKRRITATGRDAVRWLVRDGALPENLLLQLPGIVREGVLHPPEGARDSGQARVNRLFRLVQGRLIRREVVLAVGKQDDAPKRVRDARGHLRPEGILVLGHQERHPLIAADLGLPVPTKGSWLSVRVTPDVRGQQDRALSVIGGRPYFVAFPGEAAAPGPATY